MNASVTAPPAETRDPLSHSWFLGLLGEHIGGSLTPAMHEAEARRRGMLLSYRTLDATVMGAPAVLNRTADEQTTNWPRLVELAREFTFDGVNVTHPAKQLVQPALDELSEEAELLGAVNTIRFDRGRAIGLNTDYSGFTDALTALGQEQGGQQPDLSRVLQLGAGGAGAAVAYALLSAGVEELALVDVDEVRGRALIGRLSQAFDNSRMRFVSVADAPGVLGRSTGLVNTTPIGMAGVSETSPVDVAALHAGLWVGDAVYRPLKTVLVRTAEALGCAAFGGVEMAVGQAAVAFEHFTGVRADRTAMRGDFTAAALTQWAAEGAS